MALNIKDPETERLATEVAQLTGDTKTGAIRKALKDARDKLVARDNADQRVAKLLRFLEEEIWPQIPADLRGQKTTKEEREDILGIGPEGW